MSIYMGNAHITHVLGGDRVRVSYSHNPHPNFEHIEIRTGLVTHVYPALDELVFEGYGELFISEDHTIDILSRPLTYAVGDVLTTEEDYTGAPVGTVVEADKCGHVRYMSTATRGWIGVSGQCYASAEMIEDAPRTVVLAAPERAS
jgi:hypothetical protein